MIWHPVSLGDRRRNNATAEIARVRRSDKPRKNTNTSDDETKPPVSIATSACIAQTAVVNATRRCSESVSAVWPAE